MYMYACNMYTRNMYTHIKYMHQYTHPHVQDCMEMGGPETMAGGDCVVIKMRKTKKGKGQSRLYSQWLKIQDRMLLKEMQM